ncbi:MAG: radical SAM protein [Candidatus Thermoplasmatota archaeon]
MKKVYPWLLESAYTQPLSPACKMCAQGKKMVLLVTGLCSAKCFYCPLSFKKSGKDVIYADEWKLTHEKDTEKLILEANYIQASGVGITGGDPLLVWRRVEKYILLLKDTFGSKFHIHLYTSGTTNTQFLENIIAAGLDEIRFHPQPHLWSQLQYSPYKKLIKDLQKTDIDIAFEIPVIPGYEQDIINLIEWADMYQLQWVNLNELEYSEQNSYIFHKKGYTIKHDLSAAVQGSQETASRVLETVAHHDVSIGVHYCSVSFKDGIQLRNRIKRRAQGVAKPYEIISDDGTLLKGVVISKNRSVQSVYTQLHTTYKIPQRYLFKDVEKNRVELAGWILEKHAATLRAQGYECFIVEEYPTADRLEVERIPLP